jgi:hypothetical protein
MSSNPITEITIEPSTGAEVARYFDADGGLLFVGASKSALISFLRHYRGAPWRKSIARLTITRFGQKSDALAAKRRAIAEEKPLHNGAVGRPRRSAAP